MTFETYNLRLSSKWFCLSKKSIYRCSHYQRISAVTSTYRVGIKNFTSDALHTLRISRAIAFLAISVARFAHISSWVIVLSSYACAITKCGWVEYICWGYISSTVCAVTALRTFAMATKLVAWATIIPILCFITHTQACICVRWTYWARRLGT